MAEEENQEGEEKEVKAKGEEAPTPSGSKKLLFISGGIVLLILLIGTPLLIFFLMGSGESEVEMENPNAAADQKELVLMMEGFEEDDEAAENEEPIGAFYPFETFVVNLSGGGYLRCQAQVEFTKRDIPRKFFSKLVPIRDSLINALSNKTRKDLANEEGRADLKAEMRDLINEKLRKKEVAKVYFTQFVIQ